MERKLDRGFHGESRLKISLLRRWNRSPTELIEVRSSCPLGGDEILAHSEHDTGGDGAIASGRRRGRWVRHMVDGVPGIAAPHSIWPRRRGNARARGRAGPPREHAPRFPYGSRSRRPFYTW